MIQKYFADKTAYFRAGCGQTGTTVNGGRKEILECKALNNGMYAKRTETRLQTSLGINSGYDAAECVVS